MLSTGTSKGVFLVACTKVLTYIRNLVSDVDVPNSVTYPTQTPIFEWSADWSGSMNGYRLDVSLEEIGLCAQNMIIILVGSTIKIVRGTYTVV